jgi:hypothetical protein
MLTLMGPLATIERGTLKAALEAYRVWLVK